MRLGLSLFSPPASLAAVAGEAPLTSPSSYSDTGIVGHLGPEIKHPEGILGKEGREAGVWEVI